MEGKSLVIVFCSVDLHLLLFGHSSFLNHSSSGPWSELQIKLTLQIQSAARSNQFADQVVNSGIDGVLYPVLQAACDDKVSRVAKEIVLDAVDEVCPALSEHGIAAITTQNDVIGQNNFSPT